MPGHDSGGGEGSGDEPVLAAAAAELLFHLEEAGFSTPTVQILVPVTVSLGTGRVLGLLGPNGLGKTTLLKLLARQLRATCGRVSYAGRPVGKELHDVNHAAQTYDEILALRAGRISAHGPAHELMRPETLSAICEIAMGISPHPSRDGPLAYVA